jgi:hypothetical protein
MKLLLEAVNIQKGGSMIQCENCGKDVNNFEIMILVNVTGNICRDCVFELNMDEE